jgi:lipopolysaccharide/colanic/teichoic acid biosynthesis glycosyltransferase
VTADLRSPAVSLVEVEASTIATPLDVDLDVGVAVAGPAVTGRSWSSSWPAVAKEVADRVVAGILLLLAVPLLAALVLTVRLTSPGPALFTQPRVGRGGRVFRIVKLRTMAHGAEAELADGRPKVPGDPRITAVGRLLRRWSLDELPNLWNVVRGDMSLVGPRPDVPGGVMSGPAIPARRLDVRPGLTGLWQVSGRSALGVAERTRLDLDYIDSWSFALDARILARTVVAVVKGTGAY